MGLIRPQNRLVAVGLLSAGVYGLVLVHGPFREGRMESFFLIFGAAFILYGVACQAILRLPPMPLYRGWGLLIFGFAAIFHLTLLLSPPNLSDDMFRYVWDGRVQANGVNPYRYPASDPRLSFLRDDAIWEHMNRPDAVTIYPPLAQLSFALAWRFVGDSVIGFKAFFVMAVFIAAGILGSMLRAMGKSPIRTLIFLWNPLLIFEIAHAGHVDALYLPLLVGAMWLRVRTPAQSVRQLDEAAIGVLLGLATLIKLYPIFLAPPLWSVRSIDQRRRWRWLMPISLMLTVGAGYALYLEPGVNTLGFLAQYSKEFFNIAPGVKAIVDWGYRFHVPFYQSVNLVMFSLIALTSLWFWYSPAPTGREAVYRCSLPIGIYVLINLNLFSWYVLWMLPYVALTITRGRLNFGLAWWVFSGLIALSYTFFIDWEVVDWAIAAQFYPLYALLLAALVFHIRTERKEREL